MNQQKERKGGREPKLEEQGKESQLGRDENENEEASVLVASRAEGNDGSEDG